MIAPRTPFRQQGTTLFSSVLLFTVVRAQSDPSITDVGYISQKYEICKDDIGACSGLITGIIAFVAACLLLYWYLKRRKSTKKETKKADIEQSAQAERDRMRKDVERDVMMEHSKRLGALLVPPSLQLPPKA